MCKVSRQAVRQVACSLFDAREMVLAMPLHEFGEPLAQGPRLGLSAETYTAKPDRAFGVDLAAISKCLVISLREFVSGGV